MAQVSPALSEVQPVETGSWNSPSQPLTSVDSVEITVTGPPTPSTADFYSFTTEGNESGRSKPRSIILPSDLGLIEEDVESNSSPENAAESEIHHVAKKLRTSIPTVNAVFEDAPRSVKPPPSSFDHAHSSNSSSKVVITLEGADLWHQFCQAGTEMIITKSGR